MQICPFCQSRIPSPLIKNQHSEYGFFFDGRPKEKKGYPHQKQSAKIKRDQIGWSRKKSEKALFRHSRENGNPVFSISWQILDSRLRGNDDFLRVHQIEIVGFFLTGIEGKGSDEFL
jgi:hypothetical protein